MVQCDLRGFENYHTPTHSTPSNCYPVSFPASGDRHPDLLTKDNWVEKLGTERETKLANVLYEQAYQTQAKEYRDRLVDDVRQKKLHGPGPDPGRAMGIPVPGSNYDLLYNSVAQAEHSRGQVAFPGNFGVDLKDTIGRPPETPPRPSLLPRLRKMASFNNKRDTLSSPPSKEKKSSGQSRRAEEDHEWSSPAPKKTPRTSASGGSRSKVIAGIEITLTPPSAHPNTAEFPAETLRTPTRRRPVYDNDYLSPSYSGSGRRLTGPSQPSGSSTSSSSTGSPVRKHRRKTGQ